MKWSHERISWRDFKSTDTEFSNLLALLEKKPLLFRILTILIKNHPNPCSYQELGREWTEVQLGNESQVKEKVTHYISVINTLVSQHCLPLTIAKVRNFGFRLIKITNGETIRPLWWEYFTNLEKKILLSIALLNHISSDTIYGYDTTSVARSLTDIRKKLAATGIGNISRKSETGTYTLIPSEKTSLETIITDLKLTIQK